MKTPFLPLPAVLTIGLASSCHLLAQTNGTWSGDVGGDWSDTTKWTGENVASGVGAIADFSTVNLAANRTVILDTARTIGQLNSADAVGAEGSWTFAGPGLLTLDNGASRPVLNIVNRLPIISAPIAGTNGFDKLGAGMLTLSGVNTGLSGTVTLPDVGGTNSAGLVLAGNDAAGGITSFTVEGTASTGQFLALSGGTTLGSGVTINLNSPGGNSAPPGGLRSEGAATDINVVQGPVNIGLAGATARIANNSAGRLDITGPISGGSNGVVFRFGTNQGIRITNTSNSWSGATVHHQDILWFEPGALPAASNLVIGASAAGTIQTSGNFNRALGTGAGQVQFTLSAGRAQGFGARGGPLTLNFGGAGAPVLFDVNAGAPASRIRTSTLVLNNGTATDPITLTNPLDINGVARTLQVNSQSATLSGGLLGGNFTVNKTGLGRLDLPAASTWLGGLDIAGNGGVVRLSNNASLGAAATVKTIRTRGSNQQTSILELTGGITIDSNKTLAIAGKSFYTAASGNTGSQISLHSHPTGGHRVGG
ncbi:MAG: hypothetical protein MUF31_13660 [Akkermansiaceae bacterium]|jgi:hypothetical protein|nr:hypothetical protein [Akkermansiaceae bacterium]